MRNGEGGGEVVGGGGGWRREGTVRGIAIKNTARDRTQLDERTRTTTTTTREDARPSTSTSTIRDRTRHNDNDEEEGKVTRSKNRIRHDDDGGWETRRDKTRQTSGMRDKWTKKEEEADNETVVGSSERAWILVGE